MIRGWAQIGGARARPAAQRRARKYSPPPIGAERKPLLIVMTRAPGYGAGKTRLAAEIGKSAALRLNRVLQARTLRAIRDPRWTLLLCVTPDRGDAPGIWPRDVARIGQGGGDLGARLARALRRRRNVAVIGTDCPEISRARVAEAFGALKTRLAAIGPTQDGGFWILALRRGREGAAAMKGVRWSSAETLNDLIGRFREMPARLAELRDIDTRADLRAMQRRFASTSPGKRVLF